MGQRRDDIPVYHEINEADLPLRFARMNIANYDDTTDPKVFLSHFRYIMLNQKCTPIQISKIFPEYLMGTTNELFNELP